MNWFVTGVVAMAVVVAVSNYLSNSRSTTG